MAAERSPSEAQWPEATVMLGILSLGGFICSHTPQNFLPQAATAPRIPATRLALHHFDASYGPQLGERWPAVRAALLCEHKYGALLNSFASAEHVAQELELHNAADFISEAARKAQSLLQVGAEKGESVSPEGHGGGRTVTPAGTPTPPAPIGSNIKCYTFPRGDITRFRPAW